VPSAGQAAVEDDWNADLRSFLAVIFGVSQAQLPDVELGTSRDVETLQALIGRIKTEMSATSAYASIGSDELAHTFCVAMKLKVLSRQIDALPRTASSAHCWWAASASDAEHPRISGAVTNIRIPAGHYQLLNHPTLLTGLLHALSAAEPVTQ